MNEVRKVLKVRRVRKVPAASLLAALGFKFRRFA
jgi:hypothetical protein